MKDEQELRALHVKAAAEARQAFGFKELRPHQAEVLDHVFAGRDCLAVLPTGAGKSVCYGMPALVRPGLVLVVSPLIALIRDQVRKFREQKIPCAAFDSLQTGEEKTEVWNQLASGKLRLLLVSPERLARPDFRARLQQFQVQLVAIDEAHCVSHWGNHFRPDYRMLGEYLEDFAGVQKLAVTATATTQVRDDISKALRLNEPSLVWADFARANLQLRIIKASKVEAQLTAVLHAVLNATGSGIVYASTRKQAREVQRMLVDARVTAALYHAGLSAETRREAQRQFMSGAARVVVATHAFGLGIDKPDIRFVHHAGLPGSLEQYVQEIGRAGRDGLAADCCLIYGPRDVHIHRFMISKSYPELSLLKQVLEAVKEHLNGHFGASPGNS